MWDEGKEEELRLRGGRGRRVKKCSGRYGIKVQHIRKLQWRISQRM